MPPNEQKHAIKELFAASQDVFSTTTSPRSTGTEGAESSTTIVVQNIPWGKTPLNCKKAAAKTSVFRRRLEPPVLETGVEEQA